MVGSSRDKQINGRLTNVLLNGGVDCAPGLTPDLLVLGGAKIRKTLCASDLIVRNTITARGDAVFTGNLTVDGSLSSSGIDLGDIGCANIGNVAAIFVESVFAKDTGLSPIFVHDPLFITDQADKIMFGNSVVIGNVTTDGAGVESVIIGHGAKVISGDFDDIDPDECPGIAIGRGSKAWAGSIAIGPTCLGSEGYTYITESYGVHSIAIGVHTSVANGLNDANGIAIGFYTYCNGADGSPVAIGKQTYVTGANGIALGFAAESSGASSLALGHGADVTENRGIAIGRSAVCSNFEAIALGDSISTTADGGFFVKHNTGTGTTAYFSGDQLVEDSSTIRHKENVRDLEEVKDLIGQLRPVRYNRKEGYGDPTREKIGFIAEELESVFPEYVVYEDDGETPKGISYPKMVSVLTKEVQRLQAKEMVTDQLISDLQATVSTLLSRIETLEA